MNSQGNHRAGKFRQFPGVEIRKLIDYSLRKVPFYSRMRNSPDSISTSFNTYDEFLSFPITEKRQLVSQTAVKSEFISLEHDPGSLLWESTSGSSGLILDCAKSKMDRVALGLQAWSARTWWDTAIIGKPAAALISRRPEDLDRSGMRDLLLSIDGQSDDLFASYVTAIRQFRPKWMYGSASAIFCFARFLAKRPELRRGINFCLIELQGEYLPEEYQQVIQDSFSCGVSNQYACTELWVLAYSCPRRKLHVLEENVFLEILDETGLPVEEGQIGTVVVTGLKNRAMPFIRYRLGDQARWLTESCSCGRKSATIELTGCRTDQQFVQADGRLFDGSLFMEALREICIGPVAFYITGIKVIQEQYERFHVMLAKGDLFDRHAKELQRALTRNLRNRLGNKTKIQYSELKMSARRGHKFSYFESKVGVKKGGDINHDRTRK